MKLLHNTQRACNSCLTLLLCIGRTRTTFSRTSPLYVYMRLGALLLLAPQQQQQQRLFYGAACCCCIFARIRLLGYPRHYLHAL